MSKGELKMADSVLTLIITNGTKEAAKGIGAFLKEHECRIPYGAGYFCKIAIIPIETLPAIYEFEGILEAYVGEVSNQHLTDLCDRSSISDFDARKQMLDAAKMYNDILNSRHPYMKLKKPLPTNIVGS